MPPDGDLKGFKLPKVRMAPPAPSAALVDLERRVARLEKIVADAMAPAIPVGQQCKPLHLIPGGPLPRLTALWHSICTEMGIAAETQGKGQSHASRMAKVVYVERGRAQGFSYAQLAVSIGAKSGNSLAVMVKRCRKKGAA